MLVLTDPASHSPENAIYELLPALRQHDSCLQLDVASRSLPANRNFFHSRQSGTIWVSPVAGHFAYSPDARAFRQDLRRAKLSDYDVLFLRLPRPIPAGFWEFLSSRFPAPCIINRPDGIELSSSKAYLLRVAELCPPIQLCHTLEEVDAFKALHPIVLKPLENYGGQGLVRIDGSSVWLGKDRISYAQFQKQLGRGPFSYLGMKYLPQVRKGDKRIVVIHGKVLGAALRLPARGSWLCNASQGGRAVAADIQPEEELIAQRLATVLSPMGIVFFGFDTLEDENGLRVLSEINTLSVGGLPQIQKLSGQPVMQQAADLIWDYVKTEMYGKTLVTPG